MNKKLFITFEGLDGSGKTTALQGLNKWLEENIGNDKYIFTREPGGSKTSEKIRDIILDKSNLEIDPITEALLYASSRRQHLISTVIPNLEKNKVVFCDRYIDSSLAYQGYGRKLGVEKVLDINKWATDSIWPSLTIFFDINYQETIERRNKREKTQSKDRLELEGSDFHNDVYKGYKEVVKMFPDRFAVVDATQDVDSVLKDVLAIIKPILYNNRNE